MSSVARAVHPLYLLPTTRVCDGGGGSCVWPCARYGRRRPFMVAGVIGSAVAVSGLFYATTLPQLIVSFTLVQLFMTAAGECPAGR